MAPFPCMFVIKLILSTDLNDFFAAKEQLKELSFMNGKWIIIVVKGIFAVSVVSDLLELISYHIKDKTHIQFKQMYSSFTTKKN